MSNGVPANPHTFAVFGGTGDLMGRKLLPALYSLTRTGHWPPGSRILGVARSREISEESYRTWAAQRLVEHKVDLALYDRAPWRPQVWALLRAARATDLEGLLSVAGGAGLTADEIKRWRDRVLSWFETQRHRADHGLQYLTVEGVLAFIDRAAARVHGQLG